jgi:hypothetical protein
MAHITVTRQVDLIRRSNYQDLLPPDLELNNFAVFGGQPQMRMDLAAHALSRYAGRVGIVVIHNSSTFVNGLRQLPARLGNPRLMVQTDQGRRYDPLYGMSANAIVDLLVPKDPMNPMQQGMNMLRSGILAYLRIMEYQFAQGGCPFGEYPYNLNLLLQLTEKPYDNLKRSVLRHMPQDAAEAIAAVLSMEGRQQEVYSCVSSFASTMSEYLWQSGDFREHTCVSIIDAVTKGQIFCLRVPHSHGPLLDYLDAELQVLVNRNIPFLLVNCGVDISGHPVMQSWFLDAHMGRNYYAAVVAGSVANITLDEKQRGKLLSAYQQIFVLRCTTAEQAEFFCSQFGQYYRLQAERHQDRSRAPFHLFATHQAGVVHHQVEEWNIRPNELTELGDGLLLFGSVYSRPILIRHFDNTGGILYGALLPGL